MGVDAVGLIKYRRDTALGIKCGALIEVALAEHANSGEICCFQGESESCSAAADNQDIEIKVFLCARGGHNIQSTNCFN